MKLMQHWHERMMRNAPEAPGGAPDPAPTPEPAPAAPTGPDLSFIPADYHVDGAPDLGKFKEHYQSLVAEQAQWQQSKPEIPEAYDFTPPADLKFAGIDGLPEGFAVQFDKDNPLFGELSATLKEMGAPAEAGAKMAALLAKYEAANYAKAVSEMREDMKALGTPAQAEARVATVHRKLQTALPADQVEALGGALKSSKALMALEKLLGPRSMAAPTPAPNGAQNLEGMTPYERLKAINAKAM